VQVKIEQGRTLWIYSTKHGPMSILGTAVYPHSHLCMSLKQYWQLGCQSANSHQAGIVESRVDHPETCQGYREKMVRNAIEDIEWIRDP
jgi:hypothetical protein